LISSPESLELTHQIRGENQAILVGIGTVLQDNPRLNCRIPGGCPQQPLRIILDSSLRLPQSSIIVQTAGDQPTLVMHGPPGSAETKGSFHARRDTLRQSGILTHEISRNQNGGLVLDQVMAKLQSMGIISVFVEGGSAVLTSFIRSGYYDLLTIMIAPVLIGTGIEAIADLGILYLTQARKLETVWMKSFGIDMVWRLRPILS